MLKKANKSIQKILAIHRYSTGTINGNSKERSLLGDYDER